MADFDLVIIGSGPAGYVGAIDAAQKGMKVACIEKDDSLGGTCLNVGCIPSKALLHASEILHNLHSEGKQWGIQVKDVTIDFDQMMKEKASIVEKLTGGISYLLKKNKVERIVGTASFVSKDAVEVNGKRITAKNFLIATGSSPIELPFLPFDEKVILSSTGALSLKRIPESMIVVGGGVIGLELGSFYQRLGTKVTVVEFLDRIISEYDEDVSKVFQRILEKSGMEFKLKTKVTSGEKTTNGIKVQVESSDEKQEIIADCALVCIGRKAYFDGLGLDSIGVKTSDRNTIEVDGNFRTNINNIYAVGDVIGGAMLAHKGSFEAVAAVDVMLGRKTTFRYAAIPGVIYTSPEVATTGISEKELKIKKVDYKAVKFPFSANSRYVATGGADPCFVKYLVCKKTRKLLGASIVAPHAGELIGEPTLAIANGLTVDQLAHTIHAHPTFLEALLEVAHGFDGDFHHI